MQDHDIERRVRERLAALDVPFETIDIDPAHADTATFCERYGYDLDESANCIIIASRSDPPEFVACVNLATTRLDVNRRVRKLMGARKASFASEEDTRALTGMRLGGVTPFALPDGLPVYVDAQVMQRDRVIVGGGSRALKILVDPAALAALDDAEVVEGLASPAG